MLTYFSQNNVLGKVIFGKNNFFYHELIVVFKYENIPNSHSSVGYDKEECDKKILHKRRMSVCVVNSMLTNYIVLGSFLLRVFCYSIGATQALFRRWK